jgi:hypothetical protein
VWAAETEANLILKIRNLEETRDGEERTYESAGGAKTG